MDPRSRNYPNGGSSTGRPSNESRRPPGAPGGPPPSDRSSARSGSAMSRAERFEDERRRITASCFSKIDPNDGQRAYIHVFFWDRNARADIAQCLNPTSHTSAFKKTPHIRNHPPHQTRTQRTKSSVSSLFRSIKRSWCAYTRGVRMRMEVSQLERHGRCMNCLL